MVKMRRQVSSVVGFCGKAAFICFSFWVIDAFERMVLQLKDTTERIKAVDQAAAMVEEMLKQGQQAQQAPSRSTLAGNSTNGNVRLSRMFTFRISVVLVGRIRLKSRDCSVVSIVKWGLTFLFLIEWCSSCGEKAGSDSSDGQYLCGL